MALAFATTLAAAPVRLPRHPDYHAGKIAFSYLGDIWTANEDGTAPQRLTDHRGHEMYPRFSPDGRWIAFSSNRYGNNDVFVVPATGGAPSRLTFHTGTDEVVGWSRDSQQVLFRASHGDGAFPNVATLYQVPVGGGQEQPLPVDWGYYGSFSPDGKSLVFNRHPAVWTRQHYRGSFAADFWIADLAAKTYTKLLPTSATTATGRCGAPTAPSTSSPIRCRTTRREAGQPRGPQEREQHLQDPRVRRASRCR